MMMRTIVASVALVAGVTAADATTYTFDNFHQVVCCKSPYGGGGQTISFATGLDNGVATLADLQSFRASDTRALDPASYVDITLAGLTAFRATVVNSNVTDYAFTGTNDFTRGLRATWSFSKSEEVPYYAGTPGVPEPGTWATMVLGFMAVGYTIRRRRVAMATAQG